MFCVRQSSVRGCRFSFVFVYFVIKVLNVRRFLPPSSRIYQLHYIGAETREEGGTRCQRALLHHTLERWSPTNPGSASLEPGFAQAPVQGADAQAHDQMHPAPGLVCRDRPDGHLHSCFDPSATQTISTVSVRGSGMTVQGPPPRALPISPSHCEGRRVRPYPATGSERQCPQLPRRLAYLGPIQGAVVRSQGLVASAPPLVWARCPYGLIPLWVIPYVYSPQ